MSDRVEVISTVLLAVAAVAIAWSTYQANRWNGEYKKASGHTNKLRIQAAEAQGLAEAETEIDLALFIQWVNGRARGENDLARFYSRRFRKEFKPALAAWVATKPFTNPRAPLSPFAMPEYSLAATREAKQLAAQADQSSAEGALDIERQSNYLLCVVLFAISLFFAGMSTKFGGRRLRIAMLAVGSTFFLGTLVWLATFPVTVAV